MNDIEKFELANDVDFLIAIENAQDNKPPLQTRTFIDELEKQDFKIVKK
jgi:hypothetical protein